jgi:hypothetical protein
MEISGKKSNVEHLTVYDVKLGGGIMSSKTDFELNELYVVIHYTR